MTSLASPPAEPETQKIRPTLATPFSHDQLEAHAVSLARAHRVELDPSRGKPLLPRLDTSADRLEQAYRFLSSIARTDPQPVGSEDWLRDNYHVEPGADAVAVRDLPGQLDARALYEGGLIAAVIAVPAGVIGRVLADRPDQPDWLWVLGAGVAAWRQDRGLPLVHGVVTAVGVFVVVQTLGVVIRLARGDSVTWSRIASSLLLSLMAGTVGGLLGSFLLSHGGPSRR